MRIETIARSHNWRSLQMLGEQHRGYLSRLKKMCTAAPSSDLREYN